jgi:hypothetical protein
VFFAGARFVEPAVFRRYDSWHELGILTRKVRIIVAFFTALGGRNP